MPSWASAGGNARRPTAICTASCAIAAFGPPLQQRNCRLALLLAMTAKPQASQIFSTVSPPPSNSLVCRTNADERRVEQRRRIRRPDRSGRSPSLHGQDTVIVKLTPTSVAPERRAERVHVRRFVHLRLTLHTYTVTACWHVPCPSLTSAHSRRGIDYRTVPNTQTILPNRIWQNATHKRASRMALIYSQHHSSTVEHSDPTLVNLLQVASSISRLFRPRCCLNEHMGFLPLHPQRGFIGTSLHGNA